MNTHDRGWRLNHGRRWRGHRPTLGEAMRAGNDAIKAVGIVAAIVIAYGIVGRIDYESALAMDEFRLPAANTIIAPRAAAQWGDE